MCARGTAWKQHGLTWAHEAVHRRNLRREGHGVSGEDRPGDRVIGGGTKVRRKVWLVRHPASRSVAPNERVSECAEAHVRGCESPLLGGRSPFFQNAFHSSTARSAALLRWRGVRITGG